MTIPLPPQFQLRAEAEVAAGRAESIEKLAEEAMEANRVKVEAFRLSLDAAVDEADRDGWIEGAAFLAEMDAMIDELEREAHAPA